MSPPDRTENIQVPCGIDTTLIRFVFSVGRSSRIITLTVSVLVACKSGCRIA